MVPGSQLHCANPARTSWLASWAFPSTAHVCWKQPKDGDSQTTASFEPREQETKLSSKRNCMKLKSPKSQQQHCAWSGFVGLPKEKKDPLFSTYLWWPRICKHVYKTCQLSCRFFWMLWWAKSHWRHSIQPCSFPKSLRQQSLKVSTVKIHWSQEDLLWHFWDKTWGEQIPESTLLTRKLSAQFEEFEGEDRQEFRSHWKSRH